jgi:hypothetical protein
MSNEKRAAAGAFAFAQKISARASQGKAFRASSVFPFESATSRRPIFCKTFAPGYILTSRKPPRRVSAGACRIHRAKKRRASEAALMGVQTNIPEQIHPEVLARIAEQARRAGSSVNNFLSRLLDEAEAEASEAGVEMTPEERARAFEEWANSRRSAAPPLSDEAVSRESIYTREDEQL